MTTVSLYFTISGVEHSKDFYFRRNIKKPVLYPRYQGYVGALDTVCAYVGSKEIIPTSTLSIVDKSDDVEENSASAFEGEIQWQGKGASCPTDKFLLTDVVGDFSGVTPTPFYWKHSLPSADIDPDSVGILDGDLREVNENSYRAVRINAHNATTEAELSGEYESCSVFSNYRNSYNPETGNVRLYFVRFQANGNDHYQLLNSTPAFDKATLDDISLVTGQLKYWRKVYISSLSGTEYSVSTPLANVNYFLKTREEGRIFLLDPADKNDESPWFLRVSNGSFYRASGSAGYNYSVPEYSSQAFSPLYPYKAQVEELATRIRPDVIVVGKSPIKVEENFLYPMEIVIRDSQGKVLYALTTDPSKNGDSYYEDGERVYREIETDNAWVTWDSDAIAGWDEDSGFIHLTEDYSEEYLFYVSYHYEETAYELTTLNVNPTFDESYNGQYYVLYIVPTGGNNGNSGQTRSIFHLKVNRSGQVIACSQGSDDGNYDLRSEILTDGQYIHYSRSNSSQANVARTAGESTLSVYKSQLSLNESGTVDLPPRGVLLIGSGLNGSLSDGTSNSPWPVGYSSWTSDSTSVTFSLSGTLDYSVVKDETVSLYSFKELCSVEGSNNLQWLILAEIHVQAPSSINSLSVIDLRRQGGVISPRFYSESMALDPRSFWARSESFDTLGQPVPGETAAIIKVPYTLLEDYGGSFTEDEIYSIVADRHLAVGVVPVIIYHGAIPNITSLTSTTNSVTVCWDSEGTDYEYNVYYASQKDGPWTKDTATPVSDYTYGNCHTISDLDNGLIYYVTVTSVDTNSVESPKSVAWGIRTRLI